MSLVISWSIVLGWSAIWSYGPRTALILRRNCIKGTYWSEKSIMLMIQPRVQATLKISLSYHWATWIHILYRSSTTTPEYETELKSRAYRLISLGISRSLGTPIINLTGVFYLVEKRGIELHRYGQALFNLSEPPTLTNGLIWKLSSKCFSLWTTDRRNSPQSFTLTLLHCAMNSFVTNRSTYL